MSRLSSSHPSKLAFARCHFALPLHDAFLTSSFLLLSRTCALGGSAPIFRGRRTSGAGMMGGRASVAQMLRVASSRAGREAEGEKLVIGRRSTIGRHGDSGWWMLFGCW